MFRIDRALILQLDPDQFETRVNATRTLRTGASYFIPDIAIVPVELAEQFADDDLEIYRQPLPLVIEVASPSTNQYDIATKIPEYQARDDAEIWMVNAQERTIFSVVRQDDGSYFETA